MAAGRTAAARRRVRSGGVRLGEQPGGRRNAAVTIFAVDKGDRVERE